MAYEKQTWADGDVITQEKLNHMEDGIANTGGGLVVNVTTETQGDATIYTMDKTAREIITCFESGMMPTLYMFRSLEEDVEVDSYLIINNCQKSNDGRAGFLVQDFPKMLRFQAITLDDYPTYTEGGQS